MTFLCKLKGVYTMNINDQVFKTILNARGSFNDDDIDTLRKEILKDDYWMMKFDDGSYIERLPEVGLIKYVINGLTDHHIFESVTPNNDGDITSTLDELTIAKGMKDKYTWTNFVFDPKDSEQEKQVAIALDPQFDKLSRCVTVDLKKFYTNLKAMNLI